MLSIQTLIQESYLSGEKLPLKQEMRGDKWFRFFLQRHPILSQKRSEYLSTARVIVALPRIKDWFNKVTQLLADDINSFSDTKRVYNVDESAFFLNNNGDVVLAERGERVYQINKNTDRQNLTISICVNVAGEFAPSLIIYAYERVFAIYKETLPENWCVKETEGSPDNGRSILRIFCKCIYRL